MNKIFKKEEGFTIIEVVLVLAIAGLIFLVVFLALPQLQKSRRDTQRRSDASRMAAALESYAGNSNGNYPGTTAELNSFEATYITGQNFDDPSTSAPYPRQGNVLAGGTNAALTAGQWSYYTAASCGNNGDTVAEAGQARSVAIRMGLEQGVYCVDNS